MSQMRAEGVTFIVASDRPELFLDDWDRGLVLDHGSIVADTTLAEATVVYEQLGGTDVDDDSDLRTEETFEERDDLGEEEVWEEGGDERPRKRER
jgi:ABC-type multidrug transport system ATPase subunit